MKAGVAEYSVEDFYYLARATLVKDERHLDKFDRVFAQCFKGLEPPEGVKVEDLPEEWLRKLAEKLLTPEEMEKIEALGGFDARHEAVEGVAGGAEGTAPGRIEMDRHGGDLAVRRLWLQSGGRADRAGQVAAPRAVKVWDRRDYKDLDDTVELGTRGMKLALRRLRRFARQGAATELDLPDTIRSTANNAGMLDLKMVPERHNTVKVLLFLDVGGSMDDHVKLTEELFSAARSEFKHLEYYYFHNFPYEKVWKNNRRRFEEVIPTWQVLRTYGPDYKLIIRRRRGHEPVRDHHAGRLGRALQRGGRARSGWSG